MNLLPLENPAREIGSTAESKFRHDRGGARISCLRRDCQQRNGTILVIVLVCLAVITTILLGAVEVGIRNRQQIRTEVQLEQTYWLLDAGIGNAITKFQQSPDFGQYSFETKGTLKHYQGSVDIQTIERDEKRVRVRVTAKLQGRHQHSPVTQRSRVIVLNH